MNNSTQTAPFVRPKVNKANPKVNRAKAQSRPSGILLAQANGKLYFEFLKRISGTQNHLPHKGEVRYSEVMRPCIKFKQTGSFIASVPYFKFLKILKP